MLFAMSKQVVILGASDKPERYSNMAFHLLKKYGHTPILVSPNLKELDGMHVHKNLSEVQASDTLTVYISPATSSLLMDEILNFPAKRVIFNPGSENIDLMNKLREQGKEVVEGCTLVMLRTNQF